MKNILPEDDLLRLIAIFVICATVIALANVIASRVG